MPTQVPPAPPAPALAVAEPETDANAHASAIIAARTALDDWVRAWSRRDMKAYIASYDTSFKGRHANREAWIRERTQRIANRDWIDIQVSNLEPAFEDNVIAFAFTQTYRSPGFSDTARRRVRLERQTNRWLIIEESDR